jgi:hypothetical protein
MKRSLKDLRGFAIETKDGKKGKIKDFLFDESKWTIRYIEADFGKLLSPQKVLIPKVFISQALWEKETFLIDLSSPEIDKCPDIDDHLPVSRKYEEELNKYYQIYPYWSGAYLGSTGGYFPPRPIKVPSKIIAEDDVGTVLRSFKEVEGYHIKALDGTIGHIEDILIDDEDWQIIYAVIDTKNWMPWSKKVLVAVDWMDKVSYVQQEVELNLNTNTIESAPEYNPGDLMDTNYEKDLYDFYSGSLVK